MGRASSARTRNSFIFPRVSQILVIKISILSILISTVATVAFRWHSCGFFVTYPDGVCCGVDRHNAFRSSELYSVCRFILPGPYATQRIGSIQVHLEPGHFTHGGWMRTARPNPHNLARIALAFAYLRAILDDPTLASAGLTYLQTQDRECFRKISSPFFPTSMLIKF